MRNFLIVLLLGIILIWITALCYGAENQAEQQIEVENTGGLLFIQKQPMAENQTQIIRVKKSGGILLIQINGKIKNDKEKQNAEL